MSCVLGLMIQERAPPSAGAFPERGEKGEEEDKDGGRAPRRARLMREKQTKDQRPSKTSRPRVEIGTTPPPHPPPFHTPLPQAPRFQPHP